MTCCPGRDLLTAEQQERVACISGVWAELCAYLRDKLELAAATSSVERAVLEAEFPRLLSGTMDLLASAVIETGRRLMQHSRLRPAVEDTSLTFMDARAALRTRYVRLSGGLM